MEVLVIGSSQVIHGRADLGNRGVGLCNFSRDLNFPKFYYPRKISQSSGGCLSKSSIPLILKASASSQTEAVVSGDRRTKADEGLRLYVGLPLDAISVSNTINHGRAIAAGLKALQLLGVDGVELPVWWGIAERDVMGKYDWTGYLAVAELVQKMGLKLHISLCFHACKLPQIPLPVWVSQIGESQPNIFSSDRSGRRYKDCLSLSVDDLPVLNGKAPVEVYKEFCENFKASFSSFLGSTITGISVGLGPDGELRYPYNHYPSSKAKRSGAGEFQCYDENMLSHLKQHAETHGNPLWGLSGPHDAPNCDEFPISSCFFKEHGGSWETPYGDFFLSWYSSRLISHADRLLSIAASTFCNFPITVSGKVPLVHSWYRTRSHPAELMAGFYNTTNRDGYEAIIEVFSKNSCQIILPGMDLSDAHQLKGIQASPELLIGQITSACRRHGVKVCGQNSMVSGTPRGFEQIKKNLLDENDVDLFMYQRMGASFFSPEHFPNFTKFVRNLSQPQLEPDDLPIEEVDSAEARQGKDLRMQAA